MGITVKELDMAIADGEHTYRLMIKKGDDCIRLILISDDYEMIESKCLHDVKLGTIISFLRKALLH